MTKFSTQYPIWGSEWMILFRQVRFVLTVRTTSLVKFWVTIRIRHYSNTKYSNTYSDTSSIYQHPSGLIPCYGRRTALLRTAIRHEYPLLSKCPQNGHGFGRKSGQMGRKLDRGFKGKLGGVRWISKGVFIVPAGLMCCVYHPCGATDVLCLPSLRGWCVVFTIPAGLPDALYLPYLLYLLYLWGWCCVYHP